MNILLQLKNYNEYFDLLLEEQETTNEWENLLLSMKNNEDLEKYFYNRLKIPELELQHIELIIKKLFQEVKRFIKKKDFYPLKVILEILDYFYFNYSFLKQDKNFKSLYIIAIILNIKYKHNNIQETEIYFKKLTDDLVIKENFDKNLIFNILKKNNLDLYALEFKNKFLNNKSNFDNHPFVYFTNSLNQSTNISNNLILINNEDDEPNFNSYLIPNSWKITDMYVS